MGSEKRAAYGEQTVSAKEEAVLAPVEVELDFESHEYSREGKWVPGVSEIISGLNLVDASRFTEAARQRGTAIHAALEIHMGGGLNWATVDERIKGYVTAGVNLLNDAGIRMGPGTHIEQPLYHPLHGYAGCPDVVAAAFGDPTVLDFKSGGLGAAGLQTALYEMLARTAYPLRDPKAVRRRIAVQLFHDGRYKVRELSDGFDYSWALSAVSLYKEFILPRKRKGVNNGDGDRTLDS